MSKLNVDLDLVQKYNVPGPRYTSYPPAPQFTDQVTWPEVAAKIGQAQESAARSFPLLPHPVLRVALLVLRLHDRHHHATGQRARSTCNTWTRKWSR